MQTFNHRQAQDLVSANLDMMEKVVVKQYQRLQAYKLKPDANPERVAAMENEIAIMYQGIENITAIVTNMAENYTTTMHQAFANGQQSKQNEINRKGRYGGLDPLGSLPREKEALRTYNIAHQRFIDNID